MRAISPRQNRPHVDVGVGLRRTATGSWHERSSFRRDRSGWPVAFRGSQAIAAGLVTRGRLRGPRFQRLLPDVYRRAVAKPDLLLRSLAAYRLVEGRGVLAGYSAALVLGAACAPHPDTPAEVTVAGDLRAHPGLMVHRDRLTDSEVTRVRDVACTTPLRTAFDLARRPDPVEAVVAVDPLANRHRFRPRSPLGAVRARSGSPWCCARARCVRPGQPVCRIADGDPAPPADRAGRSCRPRRCSGWCQTPPPARRSGYGGRVEDRDEYEGAREGAARIGRTPGVTGSIPLREYGIAPAAGPAPDRREGGLAAAEPPARRSRCSSRWARARRGRSSGLRPGRAARRSPLPGGTSSL